MLSFYYPTWLIFYILFWFILTFKLLIKLKKIKYQVDVYKFDSYRMELSFFPLKHICHLPLVLLTPNCIGYSITWVKSL